MRLIADVPLGAFLSEPVAKVINRAVADAIGIGFEFCNWLIREVSRNGAKTAGAMSYAETLSVSTRTRKPCAGFYQELKNSYV
jgi:hypothetical protein